MKEGWEYKKLGDVAIIINGFAFKSSLFTKEGEKILRISNIQNDIVDLSDVVFFNKETYKQNLDKYKVYPDDILIALSGATTGKIGINKTNETLYLNQRVAICRESVKTLNHKYLYCFLKTKSLEFLKDAEGVAQPNLSTEQMKNYVLPIPPLSEQQHIVEELDLLSSIIEKKKAQIKELDNLAQSLFYEMFGDPITNEKGWSYKKLNTLIDENVITYHLDGNHGGDYPRSEEFVDEGVPYIGANSLNNGFVNFSMAKYLPKERAAKLKKGLAINGDVLFAHNATVGPVAYLITNEPLVILSTSLTAYRCNQDKMNPLFLRAYMQSIWFESQYKASMKQTTRNQIPITQQKKFDFILPPISLQNQFAEKIKVIEHQKELINQSIKEVETLFNSRMDYYFN